MSCSCMDGMDLLVIILREYLYYIYMYINE